jgi:hypothetical protein
LSRSAYPFRTFSTVVRPSAMAPSDPPSASAAPGRDGRRPLSTINDGELSDSPAGNASTTADAAHEIPDRHPSRQHILPIRGKDKARRESSAWRRLVEAPTARASRPNRSAITAPAAWDSTSPRAGALRRRSGGIPARVTKRQWREKCSVFSSCSHASAARTTHEQLALSSELFHISMQRFALSKQSRTFGKEDRSPHKRSVPLLAQGL